MWELIAHSHCGLPEKTSLQLCLNWYVAFTGVNSTHAAKLQERRGWNRAANKGTGDRVPGTGEQGQDEGPAEATRADENTTGVQGVMHALPSQ